MLNDFCMKYGFQIELLLTRLAFMCLDVRRLDEKNKGSKKWFSFVSLITLCMSSFYKSLPGLDIFQSRASFEMKALPIFCESITAWYKTNFMPSKNQAQILSEKGFILMPCYGFINNLKKIYINSFQV